MVTTGVQIPASALLRTQRPSDCRDRVSEYIAEGLNTLDAFHASLSEGAIISSDGAYDELDGIERVRLEPEGASEGEQ